MTPIFDFHQVISALMTPLTRTPTPSIVKTSLKSPPESVGLFIWYNRPRMVGSPWQLDLNQRLPVYLGVKTCEFFFCFLGIIFLGCILLTSQWLLCTHCFTSLVSLTGFYNEEEPASWWSVDQQTKYVWDFLCLKSKKNSQRRKMKTTTMTLIKMINWVKIINFASINGYIDHIIIRPKWAEPFENYSKTVKYWKKKKKKS